MLPNYWLLVKGIRTKYLKLTKRNKQELEILLYPLEMCSQCLLYEEKVIPSNFPKKFEIQVNKHTDKTYAHGIKTSYESGITYNCMDIIVVIIH